MRGRLQLRRVERLEQSAHDEHRRWLGSLSIAELEALCHDTPPEMTAALEVLTEAELEWLINSRMSNAELNRYLRRKLKP